MQLIIRHFVFMLFYLPFRSMIGLTRNAMVYSRLGTEDRRVFEPFGEASRNYRSAFAWGFIKTSIDTPLLIPAALLVTLYSLVAAIYRLI